MISFYINRRACLVLLLSLICFHQVVRCNKAFDKQPKLQFTKDGKFKIVIFADLHYGENAWEDWGPEQDRNSDKVMSYILDTERPEFVVYLGDLLTANNMATANATKYWKQATSPAEKRNIPYASVFGNHDDMAFEWPLEWFGNSGIPQASPGQYVYFEGTSRAKLMDNENSGLSLSSSGPKSLWPGVSNYALRICSRKDPRSTAAILYFLDSGGGSYPQVISAAQVAWFKELSTNLNPLNKTQEFIFWHIPSKAYESVAPKTGAQIAAPCVGSINKEAVASQAAEWGIMDFLTNRPSAKAVVVGHNHGLDWCCPHGSLWLCFARHSGYGGYGSWTRGARVIELSEYPTQAAKTWIRLEDGSAVGRFQMAGHIQMAT